MLAKDGEFVKTITTMINEVTKRRGRNRDQGVKIIANHITQYIGTKNIINQTLTLENLCLKEDKQKGGKDRVARLQAYVHELETQKQQWEYLRQLYAKRVDQLTTELRPTQETAGKQPTAVLENS